MLPVDNTRRFFIEENEVDALVEAVPKDGLSDYVAWLAATGQRKREASLMTWTMVEGNERITVPKAICKNKSDRVILLSKDLLDIHRKPPSGAALPDGRWNHSHVVLYLPLRRRKTNLPVSEKLVYRL